MKRTIGVVGLVVLLLAAGVGLGLFRRSQRSLAAEQAVRSGAPGVRVMPVQRQRVALHEDFYGLVEPDVRVDLAFEIAGRIERLGSAAAVSEPDGHRMVEGMSVRAGQDLARLEVGRLEAAVRTAAAAVGQAEAALVQARVQIRHARATEDAARGGVAEAAANQQQAIDELKRVARVAEGGNATPTEIDLARAAKLQADARMKMARAALAQAAAGVQSAEAEVGRAEAAVAQAEAALEAAEVDLSCASLKCPIDGVVTSLLVEEGETVAPGEPVVTVMGISRVKLTVAVVERKVPLVRGHQTAEVTIEARGTSGSAGRPAGTFTGKITQVGVATDDRTGLFHVEIELDNSDGLLRPGMVGRARVLTGVRDCYPIPVEAVRHRDGQREAFFVQVDEKGAASAKFVGLNVAGEVRRAYLIESLPKECQLLVVDGHHQLSDGQAVTVANASELKEFLNSGPDLVHAGGS